MNEIITKEDTVLELGANIGGNSKELPKYAKHVYSFEPSPKSYKWLLRNTKGIPNLTCFNAAVSDITNKKQKFNMQYGGGSLFNNDDFLQKKQICVDVIGINELPFDFNVMLMDCEGAEIPILSAFRGYSKVDKVFVETHSIDGKSTLPMVKQILQSHFPNVSQSVEEMGMYGWIIASHT
jgi:FkbM family methyltransferase